MKRKAKAIRVPLPAKDLMDLVHFVEGDLGNMDGSCPIAKQMRRVCETIMRACAEAEEKP